MTQDATIVYGTFNGEQMETSEGAYYTVAPNYASKSMLLEGEELKLIIQPNGNFIFKQISPSGFIKQRATVMMVDSNPPMVKSGNLPYNVLHASVTYHKLKPGDTITIRLPAGRRSTWAAIESKIPSVGNDLDQEL